MPTMIPIINKVASDSITANTNGDLLMLGIGTGFILLVFLVLGYLIKKVNNE